MKNPSGGKKQSNKQQQKQKQNTTGPPAPFCQHYQFNKLHFTILTGEGTLKIITLSTKCPRVGR